MIKSVGIKNFKSIVDLNIPLGRFNVLIGENGCGKSNILEAITFASAASVDQLDVHDLEKRGMRVPAPQFMISAFECNNSKDIKIDFELESGITDQFIMSFNENIDAGKWIEKRRSKAREAIKILKKQDLSNAIDELVKINFKKDESDLSVKLVGDEFQISLAKHDKDITGFRIYSPNEYSLRKFDNPDNTTIGVDGTGLFSYLKKMSSLDKGKELLNNLRSCMDILDWFDDINIKSDSLSGDNSVMLYDQYIDETLKYFDQRSVNEAFLYLLFYYTIFISENSPSFFAIDNIESALNPKLCREFTKRLIELSRDNNKQVIVTTHNPYILDALNLNKEDQRLFVVRRDIDGHTRINRVQPPENPTLSLSEAWMKGYIGGLPNNF
ncbi:MAG: AAA family ATPase [Muribaculaceae bacterium]|nr:AAA family ATPase [Muribaculaceae bacterium]